MDSCRYLSKNRHDCNMCAMYRCAFGHHSAVLRNAPTKTKLIWCTTIVIHHRTVGPCIACHLIAWSTCVLCCVAQCRKPELRVGRFTYVIHRVIVVPASTEGVWTGQTPQQNPKWFLLLSRKGFHKPQYLLHCARLVLVLDLPLAKPA